MVAKFVDLNNLSSQRRSFALTNDGRKIPLTTVLFLSGIMHRKVIHVNFFFFISAIFTRQLFVEIQDPVVQKVLG